MDPEIIKSLASTTAASTMSVAYLLEKMGGKDLAVKLLGPTFDYLGQSTKGLVEKGNENVAKVFVIAAQKLGKKIDMDGKISPRILKDIVNEAAYCENELMAEYFGGILAGSRTEEIFNDKGVSITKLVSSMSSVQIRGHYVLYKICRDLNVGKEINIGTSEGRRKLKTFIPFSVFVNAMGSINPNIDFAHILFGLDRLGLIDSMEYNASLSDLRIKYPELSESGIIFNPSALGAELFLWAYGYSDIGISEFFIGDLKFNLLDEIKINEGSKSL